VTVHNFTVLVVVVIIVNHGDAVGERVSAFDLLRSLNLQSDFPTYSGCEVNRLVMLSVSSDLFG